ncbi:uncharacterized protein LOC117121062 [Anneissia japonica]|uniref:uncharacterized protein LOC117121062 n=1 Tax=Anneissia japonica TaxID=1529436 RepID=UPI001425787C|nr:uncharacterized protein LOC117121062 [Anneissia japonica]
MLPLQFFIRILFLILLDYSAFEFDKGCTGLANYRDDAQCGAGFPAPNGEDAICPCACCSEWNWCGVTDAHCLCDKCLDHRNLSCPTTPPPPPTLPPANYRDDAQCGAGFPAPNGEDAICPCACCSEWNWCGVTDAHCLCDKCLDHRNLSCPTTTPPPPPTLPPEKPIFAVGYRNLIGKCLLDASGAVMQLYTRSGSRCARACLAFISECNSFGFDQRLSRNSDCFLYNTTSWELVDVETNVNEKPECLFYVTEYK